MQQRWTRAAARRCLGGLAFAVAATAAAQKLPEITETVEVRVVNVDVVVADDVGRPVRGLQRGDFELRVNGRPMALDYFSPVVQGRFAVEAAATGAAAGAPDPMPFLAIVYDGRGARAVNVRRAVDALSARLDSVLAGSRGVMVVRQGTSLVVEQSMTRDRELLAAALDRLAEARTPALDAASRKLLLLQLENTNPPRIARQTEEDLAADRARQLLGQVRTQAEIERFAAEESSRQLRAVVRSMAGLPGRKAILLLGEGFRRQPAAPLFRLWWSKFSRYAADIGVDNIESEMAASRAEHLLEGLIDEANAHRVTFYSHDPEGLRVVGSTAEFRSLEANLQIADETERSLDSLLDLAHATGGVGRVHAPGVDTLLDEMLGGFGSYYSLGFTPGEIERGRVRVKLREPGLRLRYLKQFAVKTSARQLEEATLATLLTAAEDNRLGVGVEVGEAARQPDGTFLVGLLVKVPMARLSLLPQRAQHVGRLRFVLIAQAADGGLSRPASGEVPIQIANGELLSAMGRMAGYRLQLRAAAGEQIVAIGVRDEIAHQDATLRLVLAPGRGG